MSSQESTARTSRLQKLSPPPPSSPSSPPSPSPLPPPPTSEIPSLDDLNVDPDTLSILHQSLLHNQLAGQSALVNEL